MPEFPHKHLNVPANRQQLRFKGNGRGNFNRRTNLTREQHAARLQKQMKKLEDAFEEERDKREDNGDDFGLILNIQSAPGFPLKIDSLEKVPSKKNDGIYLLNVRYKETELGIVTSAAVLMPFGQLKTLVSKITAYSDAEKDSTNKEGLVSPRNADLLANIDSIGVAALEALWTEVEPLPQTEDSTWWEMWISRAPRAQIQEKSWLLLFEETRKALGLEVNRFRLRLPDNEIVLIKARRAELEGSLDLLNTLTEVRKARPCSVGLSDLSGPEQDEWVHDALDRIQWPNQNAPAVCLLDTGVNREHPLLSQLISEKDLNSIIPQHGSADHLAPAFAHGTPMAGLAAYDDLRDLMLDTGDWLQSHRLESVKIIHNGDEHDPENYGAAIQEGIARAEAAQPRRQRVYCVALTQQDFDAKGQPSSWSAAIDASAAGNGEEGQPKRVIFISAGNHRNFKNYTYVSSNKESSVESPAQAWNGITVGAITHFNNITEEDNESQRSRALAPLGGLSPFTRTSVEWNPKWPIKPDIVLEGGNLAETESGSLVEKESLCPISTAPNFLSRPLCSMNATSAATASSSRLGAMLMARFPNYWAETYRGLIVHSAKWNERILGATNPHDTGNQQIVEKLLRKYGYGEPDKARLFGSGESGVTMIIQDTIQPYDQESDAGSAKLGYFNLYNLPWPTQVFDQHPDVELSLTVTLSYFIDPNPGSRCWDRSLKYKYSSHLLRFSFKRPTEDKDTFRGALEKQVKDEEENPSEVISSRAPSDSQWAIGPQLRGKSGSLVQDIWKGSPAELAEMGQVAIYPAKGWFATRSFPVGHEFHNCHQRDVRYSLIISIDAKQEIGLYTDISNQIGISV